jgi:hypothetical protein
MTGYYTLDVADIAKQRKGNDKQPFPHQKEAFSSLSTTLTTREWTIALNYRKSRLEKGNSRDLGARF